ncbi:MAG TPA: hypothetical protein VL988_13705 [Solirubrobacteraceae bacterium]|nr:hypothetical protein [Solirubrobacteraceae bacterium]
MTRISRPFQIVLAVFALFVVVWFVALRHHSTGETSSVPVPAAKAPAQSSSAGGGTPASKGGVYHGSAPGVEGLSRAIQRARGAVAQSQQNAHQLQQKSAEASGGTQAHGSSQRQQAQAGQTQSRQGQSQTRSQARQSQTRSQPQKTQSTPAHTPSKPGVPAMQATVEGELKHGKVVAVLFWNPKGTVDATVRSELRKAGGAMHGKLAVHVARSSEVGSFGSFTHTVQVYSTPTILLINAKGKTSSLTGLTDAFSIEQAIGEIKRAH